MWSHPRSPEILHSHVSPDATYSPWLQDADFYATLRVIEGSTLVHEYRLWELWEFGRRIRHLSGAVLEVGAWKGGSAAVLARAIQDQNRMLFVCDTFTGVAKASDLDPEVSDGDFCFSDVSAVRDLISQVTHSQFEILVGVFPEDTAGAVPDELALVHIDVDSYLSAKSTWDFVRPRIVRGGVVVFDDYSHFNQEGVTRFVNSIVGDRDFFFVHNLNGHGLFIRL